ncbi:MAG: tRNA pseudouridine(55) synthase TruB [Clostridia bacterium]|nr:tRNA pseudouridine(55) synthase TruB [Clostridia bacterium]
MDGIIIMNKHKGCTSHDIVYQVKKMTKQKVGHTGTLDPMATGVLPLLIGKGTLCSKYLINHDKVYQVRLQLGQKTDTADSEGKIIEEKEVSNSMLENEKIEEVFKCFIGKQEQIPPLYSAIKVKGKKLYEYARKGQIVKIEPRKIEIYHIRLLQVEKKERQIQFEVSCSKGTYIRSLCEDIAQKLGTVGYMCELNRTKVGNFSIEQAISMRQLEKGEVSYLTVEELFEEKEKILLEKQRLQPLLNGVKLTMKRPDGIYRIYSKEQFIGIGIVKDGLLKRDIILE